jgi:hypothetical protein
MKPKLINFAVAGNNNLTIPLIESNISRFFDITPYSADINYDKSSTVFSLNQYQFNENRDVVDKLIDAGYKFVFENLQEANPIIQAYLDNPNILFMIGSTHSKFIRKNVVQVPLYFWYCESKAWAGGITNYKDMPRASKFEKKFLLMMNYAKPFRTQIYEKFSDIIDQSLCSFVDRGIRLEGDIDRNSMYWDRYVNIDWYNKTQFSVVVETFMTMDQGTIFITEKSMKPFALKHPFISLSCTNTIALLKQNGFESFENLFDESYDSSPMYRDRIDKVYPQVVACNTISDDYDNLTKQKIEHNYNWFYNDQEVDRRIKLEIIDPIIKFLNEK